MAEARSLTKPTGTRIVNYFEAAEIAEQEAESQCADTAIKQQSKEPNQDLATHWSEFERAGLMIHLRQR